MPLTPDHITDAWFAAVLAWIGTGQVMVGLGVVAAMNGA